jgi:acetyl-CoA carboxylase biotin carboxyl carrier protein
VTAGERAVAAVARAAGEPDRAGPDTASEGPREANLIALASPRPGLFRIAVRAGDLVHPGSVLGELEALGRLTTVTVPDGVRGAVTAVCGAGRLARPPVDHGATLVAIDPGALAGAALAPTSPAASAAATAGGHVFRAPTSGRFYGRPSPDRPPFVTAGTALAPGATVCLLEVMKTFTRVTYSGEPARVREVLVPDGADVNAGDPLLALE